MARTSSRVAALPGAIAVEVTEWDELQDEAQPSVPSVQGVAVVHEKVRAAILTGRLEPGQVVSQVQLARELGVTRTPLREAIRLLQREGLIESEHNKQIRIAGLDGDDLEQVYAMRIALESMAARFSVPRLTDEDLTIMRDSCARMVLDGERRDYDAWETSHRKFHQRIIRYSGPRFVHACDQLYDHALRYRRYTTTHAPAAWISGDVEHGQILKAAEARNVVGVAELLARHYTRVALGAVALSEPERDPWIVRDALRAVLATNNGMQP